MDKEEMTCQMLEIMYIKAMGGTISIDTKDNEEIIPLNWYASNSNKKKIKILNEALKNKCKIEDTEAYQEILEGVVHEEAKEDKDDEER